MKTTIKKTIENLKNKKERTLLESVSEIFGGKKHRKNRVIHEVLDKKETTSGSFVERKGLGKYVEKKHRKGIVKWLVGGGLGLLGLSAGKELFNKKANQTISRKTAEVLTDEKELQKVNNLIEKTRQEVKNHKKQIQEVENIFGIKLPNNLLEKKEIYRQKNYSVKNLLSDTWKNTKYSNKETNQKRNIFARIFTFLPVIFFEYKYFNKIKKLEKNGVLKRVDSAVNEFKDKKQKIKTVAKTTSKNLHHLKFANEQIKINPQIRNINIKATKNLISNYKKNISEHLKNVQSKKITGKIFAKNIQNEFTNMFEKVKKFGLQKEFQKMMKEKKIPGIEVGKKYNSKFPRINVGAVGITTAINIAILESIRAGKFSSFGKSLVSKDTLMMSFIPGVGTWRSFGRMGNDDPVALKSLDLGVNLLGDGLLLAGVVGSVFSGGSSVLGAYAVRGSMLAVAKSWLSKESLKYAGKQIIKTGKTAAKYSLISSPLTIGLSILAKKLNSDTLAKSFTKNVLTAEQQRSLSLVEG